MGRYDRLKESLDRAHQMQAAGELDQAATFDETGEQIKQYEHRQEEKRKQIAKVSKYAAASAVIADISAPRNDYVEKVLDSVGSGMQYQPVAPHLYGTRLAERELFIWLEFVLHIVRHTHDVGLFYLKMRTVVWITGLYRLTRLIHTWRRNHGFGAMSRSTRFGFFIQLCALAASFFDWSGKNDNPLANVEKDDSIKKYQF